MASAPLWAETPVLRSEHLSQKLGCDVYLKLENFQHAYSFKYRGVSLFMQERIATHGSDVHFVIASSGNAGIAAAYAAHVLGAQCSVYIPVETNQSTVDLLKQYGAQVTLIGHSYLEASLVTHKLVNGNPKALLVPTYDHPDLWRGHASMVSEIANQLGQTPDAIFCCVGGGGLLGGLIHGCQSVGWEDVPIIAAETHGSNAFYQSMSLNSDWGTAHTPGDGTTVKHNTEFDVKIAHLSELTSAASSLGASSAAPGVVRMALDRKGDVRCVSLPDELAMQAALDFANQHKTLVELACATTLAMATPTLFKHLLPNAPRTVVFVVEGGFKASLKDMAVYKETLRNAQKVAAVYVDGEKFDISC